MARVVGEAFGRSTETLVEKERALTAPVEAGGTLVEKERTVTAQVAPLRAHDCPFSWDSQLVSLASCIYWNN